MTDTETERWLRLIAREPYPRCPAVLALEERGFVTIEDTSPFHRPRGRITDAGREWLTARKLG